MKRLFEIGLVSLSFLSLNGVANAIDVASCASTLVRRHVDIGGFETQQASRSYAVDGQAWEYARTKLGANGTLYGIPLGGSFEEYRRSRQQMSASSDERFARTVASWLITEDLGDNGLEAYRACVAASGSKPLTIFPTRVTPCGLNVAISYIRPQNGPERVPLRFIISPTGSIPNEVLPTEAADRFVRRFPVERSDSREIRIIVEADQPGDSDDLIVPPLSAFPPPHLPEL